MERDHKIVSRPPVIFMPEARIDLSGDILVTPTEKDTTAMS